MSRRKTLVFLLILFLSFSFVNIPSVKSVTSSITYSAITNVMTVTGYTSVSPCTFWDLWNASNINGWNVVHNNNGSNVQFQFDCRIYIGDGSTATYFGDSSVQVTFSSKITGSSQIFHVKANAEIRLGELLDATTKTVKNGVQILSNQTQASFFMFAWANSNGVYLYDFSFTTAKPLGQGFLLYTNNLEIYGSNLDNTKILGFANAPSGTWDIYRVNIKRGAMGLQRIWGTIKDVFAYNYTYSCWFGAGGSDTLRDYKIRNCTYTFYVIGSTFDRYIINPDFDVWSIFWSGAGGGSTNEIFRQYDFDATFTFSNLSFAENANVTISNDFLGTSQNWILSSNGSIPSQVFSMGHYNQTGGDTIYNYNPYNITATLDGYQTYSTLFNITQKTDLTIALTPTQPTPETEGSSAGGVPFKPSPLVLIERELGSPFWRLWLLGDVTPNGIIASILLGVLIILGFSIIKKLRKKRKLKIAKIQFS